MPTETVKSLIEELDRTGLANLPGRLLYSGIGTLAPAAIYVLGYNPGGDPLAEKDSPGDHLRKLLSMPSDWNEYLDGV